jgi:hypothetical protein
MKPKSLFLAARFVAVGFLAVAAGTASAGAASTFVFIDESAPGSGFSATQARAPVGGNTATTLGAQRQGVFERAGEIRGRFLLSPVPIRVVVTFEPLGASALAAAGPESVERDFPGAPQAGTFYTAALANSLAGVDLAPGLADIGVTASSDTTFHHGLDSAVPQGSFSLLDVILHELGHGLGFISFVDTNGRFFDNIPDGFNRRIFDRQLNRAWPQLSDSERVVSQTNDPFLVWTGPATTRAARFVLNPEPGPGRASLTATAPGGQTVTPDFLPAAFGPAFPSA